MSAEARASWFFGAAVAQQAEQVAQLCRQLTLQSSPALVAPTPAPPVASKVHERLLLASQQCVMSRIFARFRREILRREQPVGARKTFVEKVPHEVAVRMAGSPPSTACQVTAYLSESQIEQLLVLGGGARAHHCFDDESNQKMIVRVVSFFDGKLSFVQRTSQQLKMLPVVRLILSFRFLIWYPNEGALVYPDDGRYVIGDVSRRELAALPRRPLATMPSEGVEDTPLIDDESDDSVHNDREDVDSVDSESDFDSESDASVMQSQAGQ